MGWLDKLEAYAARIESGRRDNTPRPMSDEDFDSIMSTKPPRSQRTTGDIRRALYERNPVRWRRLQREIKWARKQMVKMGLNPEDLRWVL